VETGCHADDPDAWWTLVRWSLDSLGLWR
jgi:hypothetical protein